METEPVHEKSSGWLKQTVTRGIVKQDMNGLVNGPEAKLLLPRPVEFLIYAPEGVDPAEYDLLRFRLNGKDREFRTLTGGVFHSSSGAKADEVPFKASKIATRTYTFTLGKETPGAEYGILPPGTGNATNAGKIYTFAISERRKDLRPFQLEASPELSTALRRSSLPLSCKLPYQRCASAPATPCSSSSSSSAP